MAFELGPIEIAAIVSASVAVSLVIIVIIHRLFRRSQRLSSDDSDSPNLTAPDSLRQSDISRETIATFGLGPPITVPSGTQTPIAPSPSTGHTALVTPVSTTTSSSLGRQKFKKGVVIKDVEKQLRPKSEEMVVITYEDGLRKLGIDPDARTPPRPHHILYSENDDIGYRVQAVDSPRAKPGRERSPGKAAPPALESTWLPSYYHSHQSGRHHEREEDMTELQYLKRP